MKLKTLSFLKNVRYWTIQDDVAINIVYGGIILIDNVLFQKKENEIIGNGRSSTAGIMSRMVSENILKRINSGPNTRYMRQKNRKII